MSQLTHFHLFAKLPTELQHLIWEKYEEDNPTVWHEFFYCRCDLCSTSSYSPLDGLDGVQSYRVRRPDGDGSSTNIEHEKKNQSTALPPLGGVRLALPPRVRIEGRGDRRPSQQQQQQEPVFFSARLERDVFYFTLSGAAGPNLLGFLSPCAAGDSPEPLEDDHWFFRIRKLAFRVEGYDYRYSWGSFDQNTLRRHTGLEVIYIVAKLFAPPKLGRSSEFETTDTRHVLHGISWTTLCALHLRLDNSTTAIETTDGFIKRGRWLWPYFCSTLEPIFKDHATKPNILVREGP